MADDAFTQIDADKFKEEAKAEAVKAAQDALVSKLTGDKPRYSWEEKGKQAPSDYDELFDEVEKRVPKLASEDIDKRVEEKLKERDEAEVKRLEEETKRKTQSLEESRKAFDQDWYQLVQDKKMPAPSPEIQERINKGEQLTKDEIMADEGLKARLELAQLSQNKSAKLAYYEDYEGKQPAGAKAPVLGGRPSANQEKSEEYTYEDVVKQRKSWFSF